MKPRSGWWAVAVGGSIAGVLDILFAISFAAYRGTPPTGLLQAVASGVLGKEAYAGGVPVAALGLLFHFSMSYLWAGAFVIASRHVRALVQRPLICGILFGVLVFLTMRLVVLPLSAFPHELSFMTLGAGLDLLSHMFLFGVPIALAARRARAA